MFKFDNIFKFNKSMMQSISYYRTIINSVFKYNILLYNNVYSLMIISIYRKNWKNKWQL